MVYRDVSDANQSLQTSKVGLGFGVGLGLGLRLRLKA